MLELADTFGSRLPNETANSIKLKVAIEAFFIIFIFKINPPLIYCSTIIHTSELTIEEKTYQIATGILIISLKKANVIYCIRKMAYTYCSNLLHFKKNTGAKEDI